MASSIIRRSWFSWPGPVEVSAGFEDGSLAFFQTVSPGVGSITVEAAAARVGAYGLKILEAAASATAVYVRRLFPATHHVRAKGSFRSPTEGAGGNNNASLRIFSGSTRILDIYRENVTGAMWLRTLNAASTLVFTNTGQTRALNTWYTYDIEVWWRGTGAVSRVKVILDGVTRIDASTFDLKQGGFTAVQFGAEHPSQHVDLHVDEIVIDPAAA